MTGLDTDARSNTDGKPNASRTGLIVFLIGTALIVGAIGYRAFNPVITPEMAAANRNAPLTIPEMQARAQAEPLNSFAWQELASAHFSAGGYAQAASAYRQSIKGDPDNAVLWSALGESRVMAGEGDAVPADAVAAFEQAIKLNPADPRARYFLAMHKNLSGDPRGAIDDWAALLQETPPGAVWEEKLRRTIQQVGAANRIDTGPILAKVDKERTRTTTEAAALPAP